MNKFLELMTKLNISAVYWIDDENAEGAELSLSKLAQAFVSGLIDASPEEAKAAMGSFLKEEAARAQANKILGILKGQDEDEESKAERIGNALDDLFSKVGNPIEALLESVRKLPGPLGRAERDALIALFNQEENKQWQWHPLSFTKWTKELPGTLAENGPQKPILFIIDLQNTSENTAVDGTAVLSDLAKAQFDRKLCHLIVLTSECKKDDEFRKGRRLTEDLFTSGSKRIPIFAISKNRFAVDPAETASHMASAFSSALERADLSIMHQEFADIMRQHFLDSIDTAFNALESVTIEELMFAVSHTSTEEGVSETETLLRLMNIAQREGFQKAIVESANLRSIIMNLRNMNLQMNRDDLETDTEIVKLRCAELYDKPEVVNNLYSPLSPGDLFAIRSQIQKHSPGISEPEFELGDEALYVLVANACDLMLRGDGKRQLDTCILLHLDEANHAAEKGLTFMLRHLEFTNVANVGLKQIQLRKYASVSPRLLDLCWTNAEGNCTWSPTSTPETSEKFLRSQRARLAALNQEYSQLSLADISSMAQPLKIAFNADVNEDSTRLTTVQFEVRRVGRLSHNHASQLITRFSSVFGRPSEQHDFSKST